jgi:hypothetical protein
MKESHPLQSLRRHRRRGRHVQTMTGSHTAGHDVIPLPLFRRATIDVASIAHCGSTFFMTFFQPAVLDDLAFDAAAKEVEVELKQLKNVLEAL